MGKQVGANLNLRTLKTAYKNISIDSKESIQDIRGKLSLKTGKRDLKGLKVTYKEKQTQEFLIRSS